MNRGFGASTVVLVSLLTFLAACDNAGDKDETDGGGASADLDGDGVSEADGDCDDRNSTVFPGATDSTVDGTDQDCDGLDGPDADGDGFVDAAAGGDDCDDTDAAVSPEAAEVWYDGVDQDCDGASDYDADGDGVDGAEHGGDDCDDASDTTYPGAEEDYTDDVDQDCDGSTETAETTCSSDLTLVLSDGSEVAFDACRGWQLDAVFDYDIDDPPELLSFELTLDASGDPAFECSLTLAQTGVCGTGFYRQGDGLPGRTSVVTVDCSGLSDADEGRFSGEGYLELTHIDAGSDGGSFDGVPLYTGLRGRVSVELGATGMTLEGDFAVGGEQLGGADGTSDVCHVSDGDEDDDGQLAVEFDGTDCDDSNADAFVGAAAEEASLCTRDLDGDGYGDSTATAPLDAGADCDDDNADGFPGAASAEPELCTRDGDGDGWGDAAAAAPLDAGTDCDDADAAVYTGAATAEPDLCTLDGDGDGYGSPDATAPLDAGTDCDDADAALNPADADADGYSTCDEDCDDADATVDPSDSDNDGYSSCDGDCDDSSYTTAPGAAEAEDPVACMTDADGDGWGDAAATVGVVGTDCNDSDYYTFPGSAPNDDATACMTDLDGDDWGSDAPSSGADVGTDCDDTILRAFPGAAPNDDATACMKDQDTDDWGDDSFENPGTDCDDGNFGLTPADSDGDGYSSCDGDCDDSDGDLLPEDNDSDGYTSCDGDCDDADASLNLDDLDGDGYATCDDDCDDDNVDIRPGLDDMPLIDVDCDGTYESASLGDAHTIYSTTALTHLGAHVDTAGDWDGDGLDDMLITARGDGLTLPGEVHLVTSADWAAQSYVSSTAVLRATTLRSSSATLTFVGENNGDLAGHSAASAADVDNDGILDFLIGAPANRDVDYGAGKVYLVLGASIGSSTTIPLSTADYSFTGEGWYDYAGRFVTFANVDADSYDDILVGAYGEDLAYLIHGSSLGATSAWSLADADVVFEGGQSGERTGYELRNAGDLDGDGQDDIIMSAHLFTHSGGTGKAMVMLADGLSSVTNYNTADADYAWLAEDNNDYAGVSVDGAGDVDGDGADDLLIGAKGSDTAGTDAGKAYLVLNSSFSAGTVNLSTADYIFLGADAGESVGTQVRRAGDVDADGLADILIGGDSVPGTGAGGAYVIPGADLGGTATIDLSTVDHYFAGEVSNDEAGSFVGPAGDVDGDGRSDLLVGAHAHSDVANRAGKVYLLLSDL